MVGVTGSIPVAPTIVSTSTGIAMTPVVCVVELGLQDLSVGTATRAQKSRRPKGRLLSFCRSCYCLSLASVMTRFTD
jgi:hypothetical protein